MRILGLEINWGKPPVVNTRRTRKWVNILLKEITGTDRRGSGVSYDIQKVRAWLFNAADVLQQDNPELFAAGNRCNDAHYVLAVLQIVTRLFDDVKRDDHAILKLLGDASNKLANAESYGNYYRFWRWSNGMPIDKNWNLEEINEQA